MPLTIVVTRNVEDRYRGFLASTMLEISTGVYAGPKITRGVRERIWTVMTDWHNELRTGSILMVWRDSSAPGHLGILSLGEPSRILVDIDGLLLVKRGL